jgi:aminopeptidase N
VIADLVGRLPKADRRTPDVQALAGFGCLTRMHVVRLLAPSLDGEDHTKDIDFSPAGIRSRREAWELAMVRDDVPNETQRSIVLAFSAYGQDEVLAPYVEKYLAAADTMWEDKGTQRASTALEHIFPKHLASQALLDRLDHWLEESPANPAAKRYVRENRDDIARALRAQERDAG